MNSYYREYVCHITRANIQPIFAVCFRTKLSLLQLSTSRRSGSFWGFKDLRCDGSKNVAQNCKFKFVSFFVIMPVSLTFESCQDNPGTEFRGAVSKLGNKIKVNCGCVITFSVKLGKWSSHVADLPRAGKKYRNKKSSSRACKVFA